MARPGRRAAVHRAADRAGRSTPGRPRRSRSRSARRSTTSRTSASQEHHRARVRTGRRPSARSPAGSRTRTARRSRAPRSPSGTARATTTTTTTNGDGGYPVHLDGQQADRGRRAARSAPSRTGFDAVSVTVQGSADKAVNVAADAAGRRPAAPSATPVGRATSLPRRRRGRRRGATAADRGDHARRPPPRRPDDDSGSGSLLFIILGGLLVAAGVGAIVLVLMRRKGNGRRRPDDADARPAVRAGVVPPSHGRFRRRHPGRRAGRRPGADATMIAPRSGAPSLADAPTMLQRAGAGRTTSSRIRTARRLPQGGDVQRGSRPAWPAYGAAPRCRRQPAGRWQYGTPTRRTAAHPVRPGRRLRHGPAADTTTAGTAGRGGYDAGPATTPQQRTTSRPACTGPEPAGYRRAAYGDRSLQRQPWRRPSGGTAPRRRRRPGPGRRLRSWGAPSGAAHGGNRTGAGRRPPWHGGGAYGAPGGGYGAPAGGGYAPPGATSRGRRTATRGYGQRGRLRRPGGSAGGQAPTSRAATTTRTATTASASRRTAAGGGRPHSGTRPQPTAPGHSGRRVDWMDD